jgi:hypothetical protein
MKLTKQKLKSIIKEEYEKTLREDDMELWSDDPEMVMDMTGREYSLASLQSALDDESLGALMDNPRSYFVRVKNGAIIGVGPE